MRDVVGLGALKIAKQQPHCTLGVVRDEENEQFVQTMLRVLDHILMQYDRDQSSRVDVPPKSSLFITPQTLESSRSGEVVSPDGYSVDYLGE